LAASRWASAAQVVVGDVELGMKTVEKGQTRNHKCRKTVGTERDFSTFMKVSYYKIMKNEIKIN
jgi:hypothetical protein